VDGTTREKATANRSWAVRRHQRGRSVAGCGGLFAARALRSFTQSFFKERVDLVPQSQTCVALGLGKLGELIGIAETCQLWVRLPDPQDPGRRLTHLLASLIEGLSDEGEIGPQPFPRLPAPERPGLGVKRWVILPLAAAGK